jgi:iron complex outermembrane recepter protein
MKPLLFSCLFIIACLPLTTAQNIVGNVAQTDGKPAEYATVVLLSAKDSSLVKGAITEADGKYDLPDIAAGTYFVRATLVGFAKVETAKFTFDAKQTLTLDKITLKTSETELNAVTIAVKKPMIEVQADKTVFNVESSPSATGLNGLELMRRSPGVTLDKDDNISLKGRTNVKIYINGKLSPIQGADLTQYLKSLNSADIEAIELITNPGAKYDAAGSGGVINIRLKKNRKIGTNGTVALGLQQGVTPKMDANIGINYRDAKWNFFSSYGYDIGIYRNTLYLENNSGDTLFTQSSLDQWRSENHNFKVGTDYTLNQFSTLGVLINGGVTANGGGSTNSRTLISRPSLSRVDSVLNSSNDINYNSHNLNFNLNYRFADTSGHELNIDADYGNFARPGNSYQQNYYKNVEGTVNLQSNLYRDTTLTTVDIKSLKFDYEQKVGKVSKLGFGAKYSDVKTGNDFNFFNVRNSLSSFDSTRSRGFTYTEGIAAAYVNFNTAFGKKWTMQLGLRAERTASVGNLKAFKALSSNVNVDTNYLNVFPSVAFGFNLNPKHSFNLTFRRSINRPSYEDLNPFENRLTELLFQAGNPFLRPQYTNSVELGYTLLQFMNFSANYSRTTDFFTDVTDRRTDAVSGKQTFYLTKRNLATNDNYGISLSTPIPIKKWWNVYLNIGYSFSAYKADFGDGKTVNLAVPNGNIYMQHTFTLAPTWSVELSGWGNTGGAWGTFISKPQGVLYMAVQKKFWDGDGVLKLGWDDLFGTSRWEATSEIGTLVTYGRGTWEGQRAKINFSYRFGSKEIKAARDRKTGLEEERKRVK